jgi:hypothetical protein
MVADVHVTSFKFANEQYLVNPTYGIGNATLHKYPFRWPQLSFPYVPGFLSVFLLMFISGLLRIMTANALLFVLLVALPDRLWQM